MGNAWQRLLSKFYDKDVRVLMCGLDAAGKTTALYQLKLGEVVTTIPTIGFNVETVNYKRINFTTWDVSGRDGIRPLWRHYFQNTDVLFFVIDSNDRERIKECKQELEYFTREDELASCVFLVMANKQDLPNSLSVEEITEILELNTILKDRTWHIQGTCAKTGDGLYEGLDWLHSVLTKKEIKKAIVKPVKEMLPAQAESAEGDSSGKKEQLSWWNSLKRYFVSST